MSARGLSVEDCRMKDTVAIMGLVAVLILGASLWLLLIMPLNERDADSYDPREEQNWNNEP